VFGDGREKAFVAPVPHTLARKSTARVDIHAGSSCSPSLFSFSIHLLHHPIHGPQHPSERHWQPWNVLTNLRICQYEQDSRPYSAVFVG
jgi:hypothetical protein